MELPLLELPQCETTEEQIEELTQKKRTSHNLLWEEFMERFLAQFLWLFFPRQAARMDFSTLTFLNKEQVINIPQTEAAYHRYCGRGEDLEEGGRSHYRSYRYRGTG